MHLYLASVACGWDSALARTVWSSLKDGQYCAHDSSESFTPASESSRPNPGRQASVTLVRVTRVEDSSDSMVTILVEHQAALQTQLGSIDATSSAIVRGLLVMPKVAVPSQLRIFRNHPSWENDPAAREASWPIITKWLAQEVLEYAEWEDQQPVLL